MSTTPEKIRRWLEEGKEQGATHVIVVCDTFDHDDYPVYVRPEQDARERVKQCNAESMQRVMEVYNLSLNLDEQLKPGTRVHNY